MVELSLFLSILAITLPVCLTGLFVAKIWRTNAILDPKITKKLDSHRQQYTEQLEKEKRSLQNKLNALQKGPELSEMGDLEGVLPELIGQLDGVLPKWLTKFIKGQPDLVNTVVKYAKENPDKAKELIGRFVKIKPKAQTASDETLPGL